MKRTNNGPHGVVIYELDADEPFPDVTTADGAFCFVERGGKSYRLHPRVRVFETGYAKGYIGEVAACNRVWHGEPAVMAGRDEQLQEFSTKADNFPEALKNLIDEAGPTLDEEFATFCRLAVKYAPGLPVLKTAAAQSALRGSP